VTRPQVRSPSAATSRQLNLRLLGDATRRLCRRDPDLRAVVRRWGAPPLWGRRPGFVTLLRIILEQQVSLASARAMYLRLRGHLGMITPGTVVGLGVPGLRGLGFTRQKAAYCHALAQELEEGRLDLSSLHRADDAAVRSALIRLHGVGPWSADIYLLMALRRPDVWPSGDLALAQAMREVKRLPARPSAERQARLAAGWAPWRAVAARILWHHYLSVRAEGRAPA
jgi:DNA-3-methyladenine glycosylase II